MDEKVKKAKLSVEDEKQKKMALEKRAEIQLHDSKSNLNLFYRFSHFIQEKELNKQIIWKPFLPFRILSIMISQPQVKSVYKRLNTMFSELYPSSIATQKTIGRWIKRLMSFMIEMFWEITFFATGAKPDNLRRLINVSGSHHLEEALEEKKGVIAAGLHLGEFFHSVSVVTRLKYQYQGKKQRIGVAIMASRENEFLFRKTVKKEKNLDVVITSQSKDIRPILEKHLKSNHVVILLQDYTHRDQLRVPFVYGNSYYNFLTPTPQMLANFHLNEDTQTPIVPVLTLPHYHRNLKYSEVRMYPAIDFRTMDPEEETDPILRKEIERFQAGELSKKEKHGLISLKINQILNPLLLKFPFLWEEAIPFLKRTSYRIETNEIACAEDLVEISTAQFLQLIEKSYEPARNDEMITKSIKSLKSDFLESLSNYKKEKSLAKIPVEPEEKYFELGRLQGKKALRRTLDFMRKNLPQDLSYSIKDLFNRGEKISSYWPQYSKSYGFEDALNYD